MKKNNQGVNDLVEYRPKDTKKHRTTQTQRESFAAINESGKRVTEAIKVFDLLTKNPPLTSRQIATKMQIERTNVTRTIRDLQDNGKAKVAYCAPCQTTGKKVEHYTAIQEVKQLELFKEGGENE